MCVVSSCSSDLLSRGDRRGGGSGLKSGCEKKEECKLKQGMGEIVVLEAAGGQEGQAAVSSLFFPDFNILVNMRIFILLSKRDSWILHVTHWLVLLVC